MRRMPSRGLRSWRRPSEFTLCQESRKCQMGGWVPEVSPLSATAEARAIPGKRQFTTSSYKGGMSIWTGEPPAYTASLRVPSSRVLLPIFSAIKCSGSGREVRGRGSSSGQGFCASEVLRKPHRPGGSGARPFCDARTTQTTLSGKRLHSAFPQLCGQCPQVL